MKVRVLDARGRATMPGAEVRVFAAGTRRLVAMRLVDAGSAYDAQSDLPVHVGLPAGTARVDVEVAWPAAGSRVLARARGVRAGATVEVRVPTRRPAAPPGLRVAQDRRGPQGRMA